MSRYDHRHTCTECQKQGPPCDCHDYTPDWVCSQACWQHAEDAYALEIGAKLPPELEAHEQGSIVLSEEP